MHIYLAQWNWDGEKWTSPVETPFRSLDLRSRTQAGQQGGIPGYGLFAYDTQQAIGTYLGQDFARLKNPQVSALNSALGVSISEPGLDKYLIRYFTEQSDPTGVNTSKPLRADKDRQVTLTFAGQTFRETISESVFEATTMATRQVDYRRAKLAGVPLDQLRRWNDYDLIKYYGGDDRLLDKLLPIDSKDDGRLPHATTVSDDFNRADGAIGANWTSPVGTWNIVSNAAQTTGAGVLNCTRYSAGALSTDDQLAQTTTVSWGVNGTVGPACRFSTDAAGGQDYYYNRISSAGGGEVGKVVDATVTAITTYTQALGAGETVGIEANDSTIRGLINSIQESSNTDTAITGHLYAGMVTRRASDTQDSFTASDLTSPPAPLTNNWVFSIN